MIRYQDISGSGISPEKKWQASRVLSDKNTFLQAIKEVAKSIKCFGDDSWNNFQEGLNIQDSSPWETTCHIVRKNRKILPPFKIQGHLITDDAEKATILTRNYEEQFIPVENHITAFHVKTNYMRRCVIQERQKYLQTRNAPKTNKSSGTGWYSRHT